MGVSLEKVILGIPASGWRLAGLSQSMFNGSPQWWCDLVPGHLGDQYYWGNRAKGAYYSTYPMSQARVQGSGDSPVEAIHDALANLAKSPAQEVYQDLIRAFEDAVDGVRDTSGNR